MKEEVILREREQLEQEAWNIIHSLPTALASMRHFLTLGIEHLRSSSAAAHNIGSDPEVLRQALQKPINILRSALSRLVAQIGSKLAERHIPEPIWQEVVLSCDELENMHSTALAAALPEACYRTAHAIREAIHQLQNSGAKLGREPMKDVLRAAHELERIACLHNLEIVLEHTDKIRRNALHLLTWHNLLREPATPTISLELNALVKTVIKHNSLPARRRRIKFTPKYGSKMFVRGAEDEISLALECIVNNAIKYSHQMKEPAEAYIKITTEVTLNECLVSVESWGYPIDPEEIASGKIFDFGYRGLHVRQIIPDGTGVGLARAKLIAKRHGGELTVVCNPSTGDFIDYANGHFMTTVTLSLPRDN